jgi:mono/diheme cytochrome c family protein
MRLLLLLLIVLAGCFWRGSATYDVPIIAGPVSSDREGERLYRSHCAACHRLRDPSEETEARWVWAVKEFGPDAHLSPEEASKVLGFLSRHARPGPASK